MKIIVALDSFKDCLTAEKACAIVVEELQNQLSEAEILQRPMADGGEGTARTMIKALRGEWIPRTVTGPLPGMQVKAGFAWFEESRTALIEMAAASGLELLKPEERNPMKTTTFGTGELIQAALAREPKEILLAVGGSATVDGGVGAATALGWAFLDSAGAPLEPGGGALNQLETIRKPDSLSLPPLRVLCDVTNPLCGPTGAARVFGPQKGATPEMVEQLELGLSRLGTLISEQCDVDIIDLPGAGAAGGIAGGAVAFMGATLGSGVETILKLYRLPEELRDTDWIITGEGRFDSQSLQGKVVSGILKATEGTAARVAVLAGEVKLEQEEYQKAGAQVALSTKPDEMDLAQALANGESLLRKRTSTLVDVYITPADRTKRGLPGH
jgi:glycerate kinase